VAMVGAVGFRWRSVRAGTSLSGFARAGGGHFWAGGRSAGACDHLPVAPGQGGAEGGTYFPGHLVQVAGVLADQDAVPVFRPKTR